MAITWEVNITETGNLGDYNISAKITDDTKSINQQIETVSIQGRMDNQTQKERNYETLKAQYMAKVAKADSLSKLEAEAKTYVEK